MESKNNLIKNNITEKELHPMSGMVMLFIIIIGILAGIGLCITGPVFYDSMAGLFVTIGILLIVVLCILAGGLKILNPNEALVLTLFGKYYGTIKKAGFFFVNPFSAGFNPTVAGTVDGLIAEISESGKKDGHKKGQDCQQEGVYENHDLKQRTAEGK